ncbi:MAG: SIMPL domain-containing protein [Sphingomonas sp.]|uniref:SIMPL domain-containing protein n=1 Tax=Sphingomonas sp. TaxID=28214 RepID=UPI0025EEC700|nr:SIMPL domain-containing protein [Sphingomonas sp.]MBX3564960.1 SIMPL domain-containing protein [Sphingomonas sp.]
MTIRYAIACAMLCAPTAVLAQTAAAPVNVEIVATGEVTVPAQRFRLSATVTGKGETEDAAKAALATNRAKLLQTLAALNVREAQPDAPGTSGGGQSLLSMFAGIGGMKGPKISFDTMGEDADGKPQSTASETVTLDAPSRAVAADARKAIEAAGATSPEEVLGLLDDYPAASRRAKADALAKARVEAGAYGEALGLRQAAIVRISEKQDMIAGSLGFISQIVGMFAPKGEATSNNVTVRETLTVEFKLSK